MNLMGYKIKHDLEKYSFSKKLIINTINAHSYYVAKKDFIFKKALQESDFLFPDGSSMVFAARVLKKKKIKKISGFEIHQNLLEQANKKKLKVFYLGASNKALSLIKRKLKIKFPNIIVNAYSPPFKENFSKKMNQKIIRLINNFKPNIVFIGMTAPKQEKWAYNHKDMIKANLIVSIGAVFDFYSGITERPKKMWINFNLEWLARFIDNPKKMWRRVVFSIPLFLLDLLMLKFNLKKF